jgi:hypothetical protein
MKKIEELSTQTELLQQNNNVLNKQVTDMTNASTLDKMNYKAKIKWFRSYVWKLLSKQRKQRLMYTHYHWWAKEQMAWLQEQLNDRMEDYNNLAQVLNIETFKSRERQKKRALFVEAAKKETKEAENKLQQEHLKRLESEKEQQALQVNIEELYKTIDGLHKQVVDEKEHTKEMAQTLIKEKKTSKVNYKKYQITIKALRDRLQVYQYNAEEKACKVRELHKNIVLDLQTALNNTNATLLKEMDQKKQVNFRYAQEQQEHINSTRKHAKELHALMVLKNQAEERERLIVGEMKDNEIMIEQFKKKLGSLLQRFRVSEMRRIELEERFGTMSAPSESLEKIMSDMRNRRKDGHVVLAAAAAGGGGEGGDGRGRFHLENDEESGMVMFDDDEVGIDLDANYLIDSGDDEEERIDESLNNAQWLNKSGSGPSRIDANNSSLVAKKSTSNPNTNRRPATSLGHRTTVGHGIRSSKAANRTRRSSTTAASYYNGSSSGGGGSLLVNNRTSTSTPQRKQSWVSPFLRKRIQSAHGGSSLHLRKGVLLTRSASGGGSRTGRTSTIHRHSAKRRPKTGTVKKVSSIHQRLNMSNSLLNWKEHQALQSFHISALVVTPNPIDQRSLHQCLNTSGIGVAVTPTFASACQMLFQSSGASSTPTTLASSASSIPTLAPLPVSPSCFSYHVIVVPEQIIEGSDGTTATALKLIQMIMQQSVNHAHKELSTYDNTVTTTFPETNGNTAGIHRLSKAYNVLQNVPEIIVLGKRLNRSIGESLYKQKFKHLSAGAFRYIPYPARNGDVVSAVDSAIAKLVVAPLDVTRVRLEKSTFRKSDVAGQEEDVLLPSTVSKC